MLTGSLQKLQSFREQRGILNHNGSYENGISGSLGS